MTPTPSPSAFLESSPLSSLSHLTYSVGVLFIICVGAYFFLRFMYGRNVRGPLGPGKRLIRILDRFPLGPQRYLLIVEITGKVYLLGVTEQSVSFLTALDAEGFSKEIALLGQSDPNFIPFNSYLSALSRRWKKNKEGPVE